MLPPQSNAAARLQTFSTVNPYSRIMTGPEAEAPKRSKPSPERIGHGRRAQRQARMAAIGLLNGVNSEKPDGIDALLYEFQRHGFSSCTRDFLIFSAAAPIGASMA
jgi:hypothetical protein